MPQSKGPAGTGRNAETQSAIPGHPADKKTGKGTGSIAAAYRDFDHGGEEIPGLRLDRIEGFEHHGSSRRRRRR